MYIMKDDKHTTSTSTTTRHGHHQSIMHSGFRKRRILQQRKDFSNGGHRRHHPRSCSPQWSFFKISFLIIMATVAAMNHDHHRRRRHESTILLIPPVNSFTFSPPSTLTLSSSTARYRRVSSNSITTKKNNHQYSSLNDDGLNQRTTMPLTTARTTFLQSSSTSSSTRGRNNDIEEKDDKACGECKDQETILDENKKTKQQKMLEPKNHGTTTMIKRWLASVMLTAGVTMSSPPTFDVNKNVMPSTLSINQNYPDNQMIRLSPSSSSLSFSSSLSTSTAVAWALSPEQLLVDDVWREVTRQFVDPTFHGLGEEGWKQKRLDALKAVADLGPPEPIYDDEDEDGVLDGKKSTNNTKDPNEPVYDVIRTMLSSLDDPYTRFLTPTQYATLTNAFTTPSSSSSSKSQQQQQPSGIGVQLIGSPSTSSSSSKTAGGGREGVIIVANTISNGAAAKAGILPGDIIRKIDGVDVTGATADVVAAQCRGDTGSRVVVEIERPSSSSSSSTSSSLSSSNQVITLTLTRSPISSYQSVQTSVVTMMSPPTSSSNDGQQQQQQRTGVIRLASFTQDTFDQVSAALKDMLETQKIDALVLDVRGNAGGYMPAGVDVAKLFLPPRARIITEVDRTGRATIYINDGVGSETTLPLYVLVDQRTASASEIMTAALQDNGRAKVVAGVGIDRTFGKGRIQNVQGLQTGAGIAVTKAKYLSPNGRDIHGVGITPDKQSKTCDLKDSALSCLEGLV